MSKLLNPAMLILGLALCSPTWAYDAEMAASYQKLFSNVSGAEAGKSLNFVSAEAFTEGLKEGKQWVAIDVRTPAETELLALSLPGSMAIPTDEIFIPENLALIPREKPVVIVCKSGARAAVVGTSLRHIGFDNVHILKGGFQGLASYFGPKQAYSPSLTRDSR
ncbi:MAG: rhodanese-like domain-containing protein [Halieaceae bacterium]